MTANEVRRQLIKQFGYSDEELPSAETIRRRLNDLGYTLKRVLKTKPVKKSPRPQPFLNNLNKSIQQPIITQILSEFPLMPKLPSRLENLIEVVKIGRQLLQLTTIFRLNQV